MFTDPLNSNLKTVRLSVFLLLHVKQLQVYEVQYLEIV